MIYVYYAPILTMMHLCIIQCTYWTPLHWQVRLIRLLFILELKLRF